MNVRCRKPFTYGKSEVASPVFEAQAEQRGIQKLPVLQEPGARITITIDIPLTK